MKCTYNWERIGKMEDNCAREGEREREKKKQNESESKNEGEQAYIHRGDTLASVHARKATLPRVPEIYSTRTVEKGIGRDDARGHPYETRAS